MSEFRTWWESAPHRAKYGPDDPVYLSAIEAWTAQAKEIESLKDEADRHGRDADEQAALRRKAEEEIEALRKELEELKNGKAQG